MAAESGVRSSVPRRWRCPTDEAGPGVAATRPGAAAAVVSAEQAEFRRPRKGLGRARMERDILKEAVGIFSDPPR